MPKRHRLMPGRGTPPRGYRVVRCACGGWEMSVRNEERERRYREHIAAATGKVISSEAHDPADILALLEEI